MSEVTKSADDEESTKGGTIRQEGDKIVITIPNPKNLSLEEIEALAGHDCSSRCAGLISNAAAFVF